MVFRITREDTWKMQIFIKGKGKPGACGVRPLWLMRVGCSIFRNSVSLWVKH